MRRVHLRGHDNILKRLLIHVGGYNLSLVLRLTIGKGTPRGLQDLAILSFAAFILLRDAFCGPRDRLDSFSGHEEHLPVSELLGALIAG